MFNYVVDVLEFMGLRDGDLSIRDATKATGPSGMMDAFNLQRELNTSTSGAEWNLIGVEFPSQFGLYTVFNASQYEGSILSVSNGSGLIFDVSLRRADDDTNDVLIISLPGLSTIRVNISDSSGLRDSTSFQGIGIRLKHYQLLVIVNCVVVNFINLEDMPQPLPVSDGTVQVFENQAIVSQFKCSSICMSIDGL